MVQAHEVCAVTTNYPAVEHLEEALRCYGGCILEDIFANHYLQQIQRRQQSVFFLRPIIAARGIVP